MIIFVFENLLIIIFFVCKFKIGRCFWIKLMFVLIFFMKFFCGLIIVDLFKGGVGVW